MKVKKYKLILLLIDILVMIIAIIIPYRMKNDQLEFLYEAPFLQEFPHFRNEPTILIPFIILLFFVVLMLRNSNLYKMNMLFNSYYQLIHIIKAITIAYAYLITVLFFIKHQLLEFRGIIVPSCLILVVLMISYRIVLLKYILRFALKKKIIGEAVILIGAGSKGQEIAHDLLSNAYSYFTPIGFVDDYVEAGTTYSGIKVLDTIKNIGKYKDDFDEILIALESVTFNDLQVVINYCKRINMPIHIISDLYRIVAEKVEVEEFDGLRTFQVPPYSGLREYPYKLFKRIIDFSVATIFMILLMPIWILIAIVIRAESKGPVFFKADRVGLNGKLFLCYKFRSMYHESDNSIHKQLVKDIANGIQTDGKKIQNDKRITKIGKLLRKYSIDEFPQLINVLKCEMTLVGPRPVLPYEYKLLDDWQKERFAVLPGMTGLWQVRGRNEVDFKDQHVLDLYYVRNRSLIFDLQILFQTISIVISGETGI